MHDPSNVEELLLMKAQTETFNEYVFVRLYL